MNRHAFLIVVCILELIVGVDGVMCSAHKILVELGHPIHPILCSSLFGKKLSISPSLPNGLVFVNNTIYGTIRSKIELTPFTITSDADKKLPFIIHIGVIAAPSRLFINKSDLLINRGIALEGIKIHSDVYFTDIIVSRLPYGIVVDQTRKMLVGTYTDDFSGFYNVTICIVNSYGFLSQVFTFALSTNLMNGLSYSIYDIPCGMTPNSIPDVFTIEKKLVRIKKGIMLNSNISSTLLDSELYLPPSSLFPCQLLTFTTYLLNDEIGAFAFRMRDETSKIQNHNYYRIYLDSILVYDTWSSYPASTSLMNESIRKIHLQERKYHRLYIQYYSTTTTFRNFHIQWITPSSFHFQEIPTYCLWIKPSSVLQYSAALTTVYVGQEISFFPIIDYHIFTENGKESCSVYYKLTTDLENITIHSQTGKITGIIPTDGVSMLLIDLFVSCKKQSYHYDSSILLHSVLVDTEIPLNYKLNDMIVTSLSVSLNEPIYLVPENTTEHNHYYTIHPSLPVGLSIDSDTGIISGKSYTQLPTTCYTVYLITSFKTVITLLTITVTSHMNTILFYGFITHNITAIHYASNPLNIESINDDEWNTAEVTSSGSFSFLVNPGRFIIEIPQSCKLQESVNTKSSNLQDIVNQTQSCNPHESFNQNKSPIFSLYHTMGLIFVDHNNWYTGSLIFGKNPSSLYIEYNTFTISPPKIEIYFEQMNNQTMNSIPIPMNNYSCTYTVGTSIDPLLLTVTNIHYPMQIEPATPYLSLTTIEHSLQHLSNPDNYLITGCFEEIGTFEYTITARNDIGKSILILQFTIIPLSLSMNYLTIYDSIQNSKEYFYDIQLGSEILFKKSRQLQHSNTIVIPKKIKDRFVIRICHFDQQFISQPSIYINIILNFQYQIFSTTFYNQSTSGIYLCETYSLYYKEYLTDNDEWKYYLSNNEYLYDWKQIDYDDSKWKTTNYYYPFNKNSVLYLRKIITLDETLHYSIFLFNLLLKEGVTMYINNMEISRYNMNLDFHIPSSNAATHAFPSYQYISSSFSNLYFKPGKNCIAIEIHPHCTSSSYLLFSLHLLQLFTNNYHYQPSYPSVLTSISNASAYSVMNSPSMNTNGWIGSMNESLIYIYEDNEIHFINSFNILQEDKCSNCAIEIYGLFMYYDEFEQYQLIPVYLFEFSVLNYNKKNIVSIDIPQVKSSYHGFVFHFRYIPPNESFIINQLLLTTNNQENCVYHDIPVVVGEDIRIPCSIPNQGIEILSCYESDKGVEWKKKKSYCSTLKAKFGRMKIRFSIKGNGFVMNDLNNEMIKVKQTLASLLQIPESSFLIYYHYFRGNSQLFCYLEMYFELDISFWKSKKCLSLLQTHHVSLSVELSKLIERDVFIEVPGISFGKQNWQILLVLCFLVGILLISLMLIAIQFSRKKLREREENRLLMS